MSLAVVAAVAQGLTAASSAAERAPSDVLWWVAPVSVAVIVAMVLVEAGTRLPPGSAARRFSYRAAQPLAAVVVVLIVLGAWRLSHLVVSIAAVAAMVVFEICRSLPPDHPYRRVADKLARSFVAVAAAVVLLCGWQLAEIIGFVA